jgi:type II secretory pathway pseudopilin PulG
LLNKVGVAFFSLPAISVLVRSLTRSFIMQRFQPLSLKLRSPRRRRAGYTLIEILIGVTITLVLLGVMIRAFVFASDAIAKGRAVIELAGELRTASETLRHDLQSSTARSLPWRSGSSAEGYINTYEGLAWDGYFAGTSLAPSNLNTFGDCDDAIGMTCQNLEQPYQGLFLGNMVESKTAEIVWWSRWNDAPGPNVGSIDANELADGITVHRRVLLVAPQLNDPTTGYVQAGVNLAVFLQNNDVSVRVEGGNIVANSLADLTKRENRFGHTLGAFPNAYNMANLQGPLRLQGAREGEDVILSQVSAFDIRLFDPEADIIETPTALVPSDPGFVAAWNSGAQVPVGNGAYVDLYYGRYQSAAFNGAVATRSYFRDAPHAKSGLSNGPIEYCTWSSHYEAATNGTNGFDDDSTFGVDDEGERTTSPPYPYPLRGVQVIFRVRDPASQQVRQSSIEASFIPE